MISIEDKKKKKRIATNKFDGVYCGNSIRVSDFGREEHQRWIDQLLS